MTEQVMTAQELASIRDRITANKQGLWNPATVERLLATVDALTQRAERAEGERDEYDATLTGVRKLITQAGIPEVEPYPLEEGLSEYERSLRAGGRALAIDERISRLVAQRDEALALADARGRALETCRSEVFAGGDPQVMGIINHALTISAPEALRQQQEREAGKDALIEALREGLEWIVNYEPPFHTLSAEQIAEMQACEDCALAVERKWPPSSTCNTHYKFLSKRDQRNDDERRYQHSALRQMAIEALKLTPPQALREREERVGALERVAEAARSLKLEKGWGSKFGRPDYAGMVSGDKAAALVDALSALDAVKGSQ